jgi:hypothetical protein
VTSADTWQCPHRCGAWESWDEFAGHVRDEHGGWLANGDGS